MIAYIRTNPVVSDPRAEKEIHSLTAHGLKVTVLDGIGEGRQRELNHLLEELFLGYDFLLPMEDQLW